MLMLVVIVIFALMSVFYYEYNYYTGDETNSVDNFELEAEKEDWTVDGPKDALNKRASYPHGPGESSSSLNDSRPNGHENAGFTKETDNWEHHF